jgi:hypothetical protein
MVVAYRKTTGEILQAQQGDGPKPAVLIKNLVQNHGGTDDDYAVLTLPDAMYDDFAAGLSSRVVGGELSIERAPDHEERVERWRRQSQTVMQGGFELIKARRQPATPVADRTSRALVAAWHDAHDPAFAAHFEVRKAFFGRLERVTEKLRALEYHRGHLERYRQEAFVSLTRVLQAPMPIGAALDTSACTFEFQAFLFQARATLEVLFRGLEPVTGQVATKRATAIQHLNKAAYKWRQCKDAERILMDAGWVEDWENDSRPPGSLRRAVTHYGGLKIKPAQGNNNEGRLVAVGGLEQSGVDLLAYVDREIDRLMTLVTELGVSLLKPSLD